MILLYTYKILIKIDNSILKTFIRSLKVSEVWPTRASGIVVKQKRSWRVRKKSRSQSGKRPRETYHTRCEVTGYDPNTARAAAYIS